MTEEVAGKMLEKSQNEMLQGRGAIGCIVKMRHYKGVIATGDLEK